MRFSLASTVLLGQALPAVYSHKERSSNVVWNTAALAESEAHNPTAGGSRGRSVTSIFGAGLVRGNNAHHSLSGSTLTNNGHSRQEQESVVKEATNQEECDPDVGVLACGVGSYCLAAYDSKLGGLCVPVESNSEIYHEEAPRRLETVCMDGVCYDGGDLCADVYSTGLGKACINYFEPYELSVCVLYFFTAFCEIRVNDQACSDCQFGSDGGYFDCTNLGLSSGDIAPGKGILESFSAPIYDFCLNTNSNTEAPTKSPTSRPTKAPTDSPTRRPTRRPTSRPTNSPTNGPTNRTPTSSTGQGDEPTVSSVAPNTANPNGSPNSSILGSTTPTSAPQSSGGLNASTWCPLWSTISVAVVSAAIFSW